MKKVQVEGDKEYNVYIQGNSFLQLDSLIESYKYKDVVAIVDSNVDEKFYTHLKKKIKFIKIQVEEKKKNVELAIQIVDLLHSEKVNKKQTLVLAIGGGVLLDTVGFACSIYLRGISVAYVPTTLLSMVDASVGSKNGIHYKGKKNMIGTFYDPVFVLVDAKFLKTLDIKEIRSGVAEIIKIAYLLNPGILKVLEGAYEYGYNWDNILYQCISMKNKIIQKDYKEDHVRKYLNFGHTFGHAIESYYNFEKYTHGEAVSIGMCLEYPSSELFEDLHKFNLPIQLEEKINAKELFNHMKYDKKNTTNTKINYVTLKEKCVPTLEMFEDEIEVLGRIEKVRLMQNEIFNKEIKR